MKTVHLSVILCGLMVCLLSCNRPAHYPETMLRAEQFVDKYPDSARALLIKLKDSLPAYDKNTRMYYHLICAESECGNDSTLRQVLRYYESQQDKDKLCRAYHEMGKTHFDRPLDALEYLHKALEIAHEIPSNKMSGRIYHTIGMVYLSQQVKEELLPNFKQAYYYQQLAHDSLYWPLTLQPLARAYRMNGCSIDSVEQCYEEAYRLAKLVSDSATLFSIKRELACHYMNQNKNYPEIRRLLNSCEPYAAAHHQELDMEWAGYYTNVGNQDSAIYLYKRMFEKNEGMTKAPIAQYLAKILLSKGNYEEARYYQQIAEDNYYSAFEKMKTDSIRMTKVSKYDEQQALLKSQKNKLNAWISISSIAGILLITGIVVVVRRRRKNHATMPTADDESDSVPSPVLILFRQAVYDDNIKLTDDDWNRLQQFIDENYSRFTDKLYAYYPLSPIELRICLLLKIAIPVTGIARLINRSKSSVTSARKKLYEKMFREPGSPEKLDEFINSL